MTCLNSKQNIYLKKVLREHTEGNTLSLPAESFQPFSSEEETEHTLIQINANAYKTE